MKSLIKDGGRCYRIKSGSENAMADVYCAIKDIVDMDREVVFICIGSDYTTGDTFGPFVGLKLRRMGVPNVYGTIYDTIHAGNLKSRIKEIREEHPNAFIIGVDSCLGAADKLKDIVIKDTPLKPGVGVNKDLGIVGNACILGQVNIINRTFPAFTALQTTRLSVVMKLAQITATGVAAALIKLPSLEASAK